MKKKITILGNEVVIAFNMATEIAYEDIAGKAFEFDEMQKSVKSRLILCYACIIANNEETSITLDSLLKDATAADIKALMEAVMWSMVEWAKIPVVMQQDKEEEAEEKKD
jgi:hypothetical protein